MGLGHTIGKFFHLSRDITQIEIRGKLEEIKKNLEALEALQAKNISYYDVSFYDIPNKE